MVADTVPAELPVAGAVDAPAFVFVPMVDLGKLVLDASDVNTRFEVPKELFVEALAGAGDAPVGRAVDEVALMGRNVLASQAPPLA